MVRQPFVMRVAPLALLGLGACNTGPAEQAVQQNSTQPQALAQPQAMVPSAGPKRGGGPGPGFIPSTSVGFGPCPATMPEPKTVVRMVIPKNLDTTNRTRRVRFMSLATPDTKSDDEDLYDASTENGSGVTEYKQNPFHMDIKAINGGSDDHAVVKVKVILKDKAYKFFEDASRTTPIRGVVYDSNDPSGGMFCQKSADAIGRTKANKRNMLTFYVLRRKDFGESSINLIIVADQAGGATGGFETPILIDPKVRNDG